MESVTDNNDASNLATESGSNNQEGNETLSATAKESYPESKVTEPQEAEEANQSNTKALAEKAKEANSEPSKGKSVPGSCALPQPRRISSDLHCKNGGKITHVCKRK